MVRFVLKTKDRQGEFLKSKYEGVKPQNGWNHFIHSKLTKVEEYAQKNNIIGFIEKINI